MKSSSSKYRNISKPPKYLFIIIAIISFVLSSCNNNTNGMIFTQSPQISNNRTQQSIPSIIENGIGSPTSELSFEPTETVLPTATSTPLPTPTFTPTPTPMPQKIEESNLDKLE